MLCELAQTYDEILYLDFDVVPMHGDNFFEAWDLSKGMPQQIKEFELLLESLQGTIPDYKISIFHECYQQGKLTFQQAQLLAELYANGEVNVNINLLSTGDDFVEIIYNEPS